MQVAKLCCLVSCLAVGVLAAVPTAASVFSETEPNNGFAQADSLDPHDATIQVSGTYSGPDFNGFSDVDFFRFHASAGDLITATLTPDSAFGTFSLFLYDPTQTFTGVAVFGSQPSFVFPIALTGDSYISVAATAPSFRSGTYLLGIAGLTPSVPEPSTFGLVAAALGCATLIRASAARRRAKARRRLD